MPNLQPATLLSFRRTAVRLNFDLCSRPGCATNTRNLAPKRCSPFDLLHARNVFLLTRACTLEHRNPLSVECVTRLRRSLYKQFHPGIGRDTARLSAANAPGESILTSDSCLLTSASGTGFAPITADSHRRHIILNASSADYCYC